MYWVNGLYTITVNGVPTFQAANPGAGIPNGTEITAQWLADVQGELLNILTVGGVVPAQNTPTQVMQAIQTFIGKNRHVVVANGNFTVPAAVYMVRVRGVAGGGGGGGTSGAGGGGGGGGGGGAFDALISVTPGQVIAITIGSGGAGGGAASGAAGNGAAGGSTSFGTLYTANGGGGGAAATASGNSSGAPGGTANGGYPNFAGGYGTDGQFFTGGDNGFAGQGGSSIFGTGGRGSNNTVGPSNAVALGSGGGGAYGSVATVGGYGAPGVVIIDY
jgi:hypothetical protein